jgi:hypothetical protein
LWSHSFLVDVLWQRREELGYQFLRLLLVIVRSGSIGYEELRNLPERGIVSRLEVLGGFPDVVVVCEKLVPVQI